MRPAYVGYAVAGFAWLVVFNNRLMLNAPVFFLLVCIPPAIVLFYGLSAEEPGPQPDPPRQPPASCTPPDSVLRMPGPSGARPEDSSRLPPAAPARPSPPSVVQQPPVLQRSGASDISSPAAIPPSILREPVIPSRSAVPVSPGLQIVKPSRTIALAPPDGAPGHDAGFPTGEPAGRGRRPESPGTRQRP